VTEVSEATDPGLADKIARRRERRLRNGWEERVVDAPLAAPSAETGLLGVVRQRYLLKLLVRREIQARYQDSFLGLIWSYINPLSQFVIFWVVMGEIVGLGDRTQNFAIHVFTGLVVVSFFTETLNAGTRSIMRNKALVQKMALPREMFPVATMLVSMWHILPELVILLIACVLTGWTPDPIGLAAFALALAVLAVLGTALALICSVVNVIFRDFGSIINIATNMVRFSVPMMYPFTLVAERFRGHTDIYLLNPIANAVLLTQRAFWVGTTDDPSAIARTDLPTYLFTRGWIALGASVLLLVFAQWLFSRLEGTIPERLT
jgi:ABC-2 type transport system permease protein